MTGSRDGRGRTTADAVVVGGGVIGCSILYNLATLGMKRPLLLEQGILAGGGSGLSQAILRLHYSNPITTLLSWHSLKLFQDFEEAVGGPSGYVRTGYLLLAAAEDREALEANVAMQRGHGGGHPRPLPGRGKGGCSHARPGRRSRHRLRTPVRLR